MNFRTILCTCVGLFALWILFLLTPTAVAVPKGIVLPAAQVRAPISPALVHLYHQAPATPFTRLGSVRVEYHFKTLNPHTADIVFEKAQQLAASIGANGVIVNMLVPSDMVGKVLTLMGTAIYIPGSAVESAS